MAAKVSNNNFNANQNPVTTLPAGLASGDEMLLGVSVNSTSRTITTPAGWNLKLGPTDNNSLTCRTWLFERVAGGSETAPTLAFDANATGQWAIIAYTGFVYDTSAANSPAGSTLTPTTPSVTPSANGCQIVSFHNERGTAATGTPSASPACNELVDADPSSAFPMMYVQDFNQPTATAVSLSFTSSIAQVFNNVIVSLKPAVATPFLPKILAFG